MPLDTLPRRPGLSNRIRRHQAVCADCGSSTTLPFRPTQGRPVYCSECFKTRSGRHSSPSAPPTGETLAPSRSSGGGSPGGSLTGATAFADMDLKPATMSALSRMNISDPTPIQANSIPLLLAGRDLDRAGTYRVREDLGIRSPLGRTVRSIGPEGPSVSACAHP